MSPEQASGRTIDHRSDIFSTGIILYELLAVRRMFTGETMRVLSLVREAKYDPPEKVIPFLPAKLNDILQRALAKDPDDRYQSAGEMLADVEELAFELKLRPSARSFAQYLKELFEEELAKEETALWEKPGKKAAGENNKKGRQKPAQGTYENTVVLTRSFLLETLNRFKQIVIRWIRPLPAKLLRFIKQRAGQKQKRPGTSARPGFKFAALKPALAVVVFLVVVGVGIKQISFSRTQPGDQPSGYTSSAGEASQAPEQLSADGDDDAPGGAVQSAAPGEAGAGNESVEVEEPVEFAKIKAGMAAVESQRYQKALALFEEVLAGNPALIEDIADAYVEASLGQAAELIQTDAEQAEKLLLQALKVDPDNISGLSHLGYLYMGRKNYPKAIEAYLKVSKLAPRQPDTFFNLGYVYAVSKNYRQAKIMYRRVVELNPAFTDEALFNLAVINEKLGEHKQSIENLQRAVALNPGNEAAKKYLRQLKKKTGDKRG